MEGTKIINSFLARIIRTMLLLIITVAAAIFIMWIILSLPGANHKPPYEHYDQRAHTAELDALIAYRKAYLEVLPDSHGGEKSCTDFHLKSIAWIKRKEILSVTVDFGEIFICTDPGKLDHATAQFCNKWHFTFNGTTKNLECSPSLETLSWSKDKTFDCDNMIIIPCRKGELTIATIMLDELQIEFDGSKDNVKNDIFTKESDRKQPPIPPRDKGAHTDEFDALIEYDRAHLEVFPDSGDSESTHVDLTLKSIRWNKRKEVLSLTGDFGEMLICTKPGELNNITAEFCQSWRFTWDDSIISYTIDCTPASIKTLSWPLDRAFYCDDKITINCQQLVSVFTDRSTSFRVINVAIIELSKMKIEFDGLEDNVKYNVFTKEFDEKCPPKPIQAHTKELDALIAYDKAYLEVLPDSDDGESSRMSLDLRSLKWAERKAVLSMSGDFGEMFICRRSTVSQKVAAQFCQDWQFTLNNKSRNLQCSPSIMIWFWKAGYPTYCASDIIIPCRQEERTVAYIVFSQMRIEFDGLGNRMEKNVFSGEFDHKCPS